MIPVLNGMISVRYDPCGLGAPERYDPCGLGAPERTGAIPVHLRRASITAPCMSSIWSMVDSV